MAYLNSSSPNQLQAVLEYLPSTIQHRAETAVQILHVLKLQITDMAVRLPEGYLKAV